MAYSITPFLIVLSTSIFMLFSSTPALGINLPASTISAAPALLPDPIAPLSSPPALSPDIAPLFPSPGGSELSPSESSVPLIPSSPSPPNPDAMVAPGPGTALAPSGSMPDSSSVRLNSPVLFSSIVVLFGGIWVNAAL
ncbi:classical arabinogalactan protein 26 [Sesamum indicum]|uniref:Classical arabinogalactan protein 26 n=1 Tax=Sesamum indicum TaxID=4182 RepID=A0A6I9T8T7_SESIN|nr:classical arabinogalactan protein 26 [Sesamum indicum]